MIDIVFNTLLGHDKKSVAPSSEATLQKSGKWLFSLPADRFAGHFRGDSQRTGGLIFVVRRARGGLLLARLQRRSIRLGVELLRRHHFGRSRTIRNHGLFAARQFDLAINLLEDFVVVRITRIDIPFASVVLMRGDGVVVVRAEVVVAMRFGAEVVIVTEIACAMGAPAKSISVVATQTVTTCAAAT